MVVGKGRSRGNSKGSGRIGRGRGSSRYKGRSRVHKGMQVSRLPLHTLTIRVPSFPMWL